MTTAASERAGNRSSHASAELADVVPIRQELPVPVDGGCAYAVFDPDIGRPCGRPAVHMAHVDDERGVRVATLFACEYAQHQAYVEDAGDMLRDWLVADGT